MKPLWPKQPTLFLYFLLLCTYSCAQDNSKSTGMDALLQRELANQERAKSGNKNPVVEIIDDPQKVQQLRSTVEKNLELKQKREAAKGGNKTPWERYKQNDKSVVPELIAILKGRNKSKKNEVFFGLSKPYDGPKDYAITEPELIAQILKAVEDPEDEKSAVQLAGFNKLPGHQAVFEKRLISGQSTDEGRLFYWLGAEGKSIAALDYMEKRLKERPMISENLDWVVHGLRDYGKNGDASVKSRAGTLALYIYQHNISRERIDELKNSVSTSDAAESVLECLFEYGDKTVLPIAQDIFQRKIRFAGPIKAMIRLDGPQHMNKVYELLRQEKYFYDGVRIIESVDRKYVSDQLLKDVVVNFSRRSDVQDYQIEAMIRTYNQLGAENLMKETVESLTSKEFKLRFQKAHELSKFTPQGVIDDLLALGFIDKKPGVKELEELVKENSDGSASLIYALLTDQKVVHMFDAETSVVPCDYDVLLMEFAANSLGTLKDMKVWMDAKEDRSGNYKYTVTVLAGNKAFIIRPEDIGDWYDVPLVSKLLDDVLEHLSSPKKFVPVETGDQTASFIFGEPEKVKALVKKYDL
jgi:hypothetical protein